MDEIVKYLVSEAAMRNSLAGITLLTIGILMSLGRAFTKEEPLLKWITLGVLFSGAVMGLVGAKKTADIWRESEIVILDPTGWKVEAVNGIFPNTKEALFQSRYADFRISSSLYRRLQREYPERLPEINFGK